MGTFPIGAIGTLAGIDAKLTDEGFVIGIGGSFISGGGRNRGGAFFGIGPEGVAGIVLGSTRGAGGGGGIQSFGGVAGIGGGGGVFGRTSFVRRS